MALQLAALIAAVVRALHQRRERQQIKKKHLPGVEVLESCQSVKAGSYFFVSFVFMTTSGAAYFIKSFFE